MNSKNNYTYHHLRENSKCCKSSIAVIEQYILTDQISKGNCFQLLLCECRSKSQRHLTPFNATLLESQGKKTHTVGINSISVLVLAYLCGARDLLSVQWNLKGSWVFLHAKSQAIVCDFTSSWCWVHTHPMCHVHVHKTLKLFYGRDTLNYHCPHSPLFWHLKTQTQFLQQFSGLGAVFILGKWAKELTLLPTFSHKWRLNRPISLGSGTQ